MARSVAFTQYGLLLALVGAISAPAQSGTWQPIGPEGGPVYGLVQAPTDPDRLYCLSSPGVLRSDDHGAAWRVVFAGAYRGIAVSPQDEDLVLVGQPWNQELWRTTDGGLTWAAIQFDFGSPSLRAISFDPLVPDRVLAVTIGGTSPGIQRSTDGGLTWSSSSTGITDPWPWTVVFDPNRRDVVFAANQDGAYRSTDGGRTWFRVSSPGVSYVMSLSFCAADSNRVWATGYPGGMLFSSDGGLSLQPAPHQPPLGYPYQARMVAVDPVDPNRIVTSVLESFCNGACFSRVDGVVRSTDGGSHWAFATFPFDDDWEGPDITGLGFDIADPSVVYMTTSTAAETGMLRSVDQAATWSSWMHGICAQPIFAVAWAPDGTLYARRGGGHGVYASPGVGQPWMQHASPPWGYYTPASFEVNRRTSIVREGGIRRTSFDTASATYAQSTDAGGTWLGYDWNVSIPLPTNPVVSNHGSSHAAGDGSNHASAGTYLWVNADLYVTDDGVTFVGPSAAFRAAAAVVDPDHPARLYAINSDTGAVEYSTNSGVSWVMRATGLPTAQPIGLFMDPAAPQRLAVVYRTAGAFRSEDSGITWSLAPGMAGWTGSVRAADWDPAADRLALATQDTGIFLSDHGYVSDGLPATTFTSIVFLEGGEHLVLGTADRSVWTLDLSDGTSSPVAGSQAEGLKLTARPNPSSGQVQIDLSLPVGVSARDLSIYDLAGRHVVTLAAGVVSERTFAWNGRDSVGNRVASGVYFARVIAGSERRACRVVVLDH